MRKNEWQQLKTRSESELKKNLTESRERLWNLKGDLAGGKVKNVKEIKKVKGGIARILTLLHNQPEQK